MPWGVQAFFWDRLLQHKGWQDNAPTAAGTVPAVCTETLNLNLQLQAHPAHSNLILFVQHPWSRQSLERKEPGKEDLLWWRGGPQRGRES